MAGQWVYTPRTLPPRVLFPEEDNEDGGGEGNQDEHEAPDSPASSDAAEEADAAEFGATPVQEMFCLARRDDECETVHKCEACDEDIGAGLCCGCNDFLCYGCCLKPTAEGCEGLACGECGFMACGSCCYAALPTCPEAWQEWLAAHAHIPPPVVSASRKRKTFDRFFGTYTPPSERTVLGGRSSCAEPGCSSHPMDPQSVRRAEATPAAVDLTAYETLEDEEVPLDAPRPSHQTQEDATPPSTSYATPDERVTLLGGGSAPAGCTTQDTGPEPPRIATASTSEGASARKPPSQEETPPAEAGPRHQPSPSLTSEVAQLSGCLQPGAGAEAASGGCGRGEMGTPIPGLTPAKDAPGSALQPLSGNAVTASRALRGKAATDSSY
eukprot:jgi/Tetstr1/448624/TSEL_035869.t1